jgi:hypothetical protein
MKRFAIGLVCFGMACNYTLVKKDELEDLQQDSDDTIQDTALDDEAGCPPEVPTDYQYLWDCENSEGCSAKVYRYATGLSTSDGTLTASEQWFVFEGPGLYCIDKFEINGTASDYDPTTFNCSQCEEIYQVTWRLVDGQCGWNWSSTFADQESAEQVYQGYIMFDTHDAFGNRNPDNAMLVIGAPTNGNGYAPMPDYGRGTAIPSGSDDGPPEDYEWASNGDCYQ